MSNQNDKPSRLGRKATLVAAGLLAAAGSSVLLPDVNWSVVEASHSQNPVITKIINEAKKHRSKGRLKEAAELLEQHARAADLVIVSQSKQRYLEDFFRHQLPEQIVINSGCPVLILPRKWRVKTTISECLIAWRSDREAVRAVRDSLEFLKKAKKVEVLTCGKGDDEREGLPPQQLLMFLERHGIEAQSQFVQSHNVGATIVDVADSYDMVVMGGFGKSRLTELVLGSVSDHVFKHMTVPVLMSH